MVILELGVHFYPSDLELLQLLKNREGEEHPSDFVIERNLYGSDPPWKLFDESDPWDGEILDHEKKERKVLHVFTKLCNLSAKKIKRTCGRGAWCGENKGKEIKSKRGKKGKILGIKKTFTFVAKSNSNSKSEEEEGHWLMHEYSLFESKTDYVICKIVKTSPKLSLEEESCDHEVVLVDSWPRKKLKCQESNPTVSGVLSYADSSTSGGVKQSAVLINIGADSSTSGGVMQSAVLINIGEEGMNYNHQSFQDSLGSSQVLNDEQYFRTQVNPCNQNQNEGAIEEHLQLPFTSVDYSGHEEYQSDSACAPHESQEEMKNLFSDDGLGIPDYWAMEGLLDSNFATSPKINDSWDYLNNSDEIVIGELWNY